MFPPARSSATIGPNGAGKFTCFNIISGALAPTSGSVSFLGERIEGRKPHIAAEKGLTRTFQNLQVFTSTDVVGNVYMGRYRKGRAGILRGMLGLQGGEQKHNRAIAGEILRSMRLTDVAEEMAASLPFGRQRMMEVCRALASEPALLLLDEPVPLGLEPGHGQFVSGGRFSSGQRSSNGGVPLGQARERIASLLVASRCCLGGPIRRILRTRCRSAGGKWRSPR